MRLRRNRLIECNHRRAIPVKDKEGVTTIAQMEGAFRRGAIAVLGWPVDEAVKPRRGSSGGIRPDLQVTLDLINQVNNEEPLSVLEATLKREIAGALRHWRERYGPLRDEATR